MPGEENIDETLAIEDPTFEYASSAAGVVVRQL
jgi:hypothetical protein